MLEPAYTATAAKTLDAVERDDARRRLWDALVSTLEAICDRPGDAEARRTALRYPSGQVAWKVPVRGSGQDEDWVVIWQQHGDDEALILYVGPWPPAQL